MKVSQLTGEQLAELPPRQMAELVYGRRYDSQEEVDVALILGGSQHNATVRAKGAARLYREGRVPLLIPSGGVENTFDGERMTEAEFMRKILLAEGVPEEAILMENEATTTKENFLYGTLQFNRRLRLQNVKTVGVITSAFHMRRSMALAHLLLPRSVKAVAMPAEEIGDPVAYVQTEYGRYWTAREIPLMQEMITHGLMEDIEFE